MSDRIKKNLSAGDYAREFMIRVIYRLPGLARILFFFNCVRILKKGEHIFLLSFDCDNDEDIAALREIGGFLDENEIKSTFAVPGEILLKGKEKFKELSSKGHEFIGHGYKKHSAILENGRYISTLYYHKLSDSEIKEDIKKGNKAVEEVFGKKPRGFRIPHFGHSNTKKELARVFRVLKEEGIEYSSSTLPIFEILQGPIFKAQYGISELPVSGRYNLPLSLLDTYSFGFKDGDKNKYKDYLDNMKKVIDYFKNKRVCLNYYCDPSQAAQMKEWFEAIKYAKANGFQFMTLSEFYERHK